MVFYPAESPLNSLTCFLHTPPSKSARISQPTAGIYASHERPVSKSSSSSKSGRPQILDICIKVLVPPEGSFRETHILLFYHVSAMPCINKWIICQHLLYLVGFIFPQKPCQSLPYCPNPHIHPFFFSSVKTLCWGGFWAVTWSIKYLGTLV